MAGLTKAGLVPSPHSAYVEIMLKFGLLGLALYGLLVFRFLRSALVARKTLAGGPMKVWLETGILSFVAAHAYCSGYSFDTIMLIFFAVGNSALRLCEHPAVQFRASGREHVRTHSNFADFMRIQRPVRTNEPDALTEKFEIRYLTG